MRNRVRQFRTLGSVRGEVRAATVTLHGHEAGNGGYGQGNTYGSGRASPTRSRPDAAACQPHWTWRERMPVVATVTVNLARWIGLKPDPTMLPCASSSDQG